MKKRFLACVLATACAVTSAGLAVFTGCGEKENSDDDYFAKPVMPTGVELTKVDEDNFSSVSKLIYKMTCESSNALTAKYYYDHSYTYKYDDEEYRRDNDSEEYQDRCLLKYKPASAASDAIGSINFNQKYSETYDTYFYESAYPDSVLEELRIPRHDTYNHKQDLHIESTLNGNEVNVYQSKYEYRNYFDTDQKEQKVEEDNIPKYHAKQYSSVTPLQTLSEVKQVANPNLLDNVFAFVAETIREIISFDGVYIEGIEHEIESGISRGSACHAFKESLDLSDSALPRMIEEAYVNNLEIKQTRNFDFSVNEQLGIVWVDAAYEVTIGESHGEFEYIIYLDCTAEPQDVKTEVEGVDASYEGNIIPVDVKALEAAVRAGEEFTIQLPESYTYNTVDYSLHDEDYNVDYQTYKQIEITADNKAIIPAGACQQLLDEFSDLLTPGTEYYFYLGISNNQYYYIKVS